jgi:hypothetical protein
MENLTIQDLKNKQELLEKGMMRAIEAFEKETGVTVVDTDIDTVLINDEKTGRVLTTQIIL